MTRTGAANEFKKLIAYLNDQKSLANTWSQSKNVTSIVASLLEERKATGNKRKSHKNTELCLDDTSKKKIAQTSEQEVEFTKIL